MAGHQVLFIDFQTSKFQNKRDLRFFLYLLPSLFSAPCGLCLCEIKYNWFMETEQKPKFKAYFQNQIH